MRKECPRPLYVVVEKILGAEESLPANWNADGTSGYEFINAANGLFVDAAGLRAMSQVYRDFIEDYTPWSEAAYRAKRVIFQIVDGERTQHRLSATRTVGPARPPLRDFTLRSLRDALGEVIACFPVYRTYIADSGVVTETDRKVIQTAVRRASFRSPLIGPPVFDFIRRVLLLEYPDWAGEEERSEQRHFVGKFQQVTSPVLAKGIEDTAFYRFVRLASLNEVGGDPSRFGISPEAFHQFNATRQAHFPHGLAPLSTHDTKRSEDVRARLNLISEMSEEWGRAIRTWSELNAGHKTALADGPAPSPNDEYLIYQSLLGAWPLEPYSADEYREFIGRIQAYMQKAIHEAKVHSSWVNPNAEYDAACRDFIAKMLDSVSGKPFLEAFRPLRQRLGRLGLFNSLAQTLLKLAAPGVADTYQGTELWDFSLVDPDNRRPVDYSHRRKLLREVRDLSERQIGNLVGNPADGRIKLYLTERMLTLRREHPGLFTSGDYIPIEAQGTAAQHAFAFLRRNDRTAARNCRAETAGPLLPRQGRRAARRPLGRYCDQHRRSELDERLYESPPRRPSASPGRPVPPVPRRRPRCIDWQQLKVTKVMSY